MSAYEYSVAKSEGTIPQPKDVHIKLTKKHNLPDDSSPPDGGYGWVIVASSFFCNMIVDGIAYCFGMFLFKYVAFYGERIVKVAWVGSILSGMGFLTGPIASILCNKYGCRPVSIAGSLLASAAFVLSTFSPNVEVLMITYGLMGGLGFGFIYLPSIVIVGHYFESRRSLATGIAVCGSGLGAFVFAPLCQFLVQNFSWQDAHFILATILLCSSVCGALLKPLNLKEFEAKQVDSKDELPQIKLSMLTSEDDGDLEKTCSPLMKECEGFSAKIVNGSKIIEESTKRKPKLDKSYKSKYCSWISGPLKATFSSLVDMSILTNPPFLMFAIANLCYFTALYIPFVYVGRHAEENGIETTQSTLLLSVIGISNIAGRLICGWVSDFPFINSLLLNNCSVLITAASLFSVPFCHSYASYLTMAIVFGSAMSVFISLNSIITVDIVGVAKLTSAFGLVLLFSGVATLFGVPLAAVVYEANGSLDNTFYFSGIMFLLAAMFGFIAYAINENNKTINGSEKK